MPADPAGRPSQPVGKPDGQPAGSDAAEPDRVQAATPMPADPAGRPSQPVGKPDGQPAGSDAAEPDRVQAATPMPADPAGRPSQPVGKPDGQPAGFDPHEPDRAQLPSARTMRDIRAAHPDPADKHALRERMDRLENRDARVSRRALIAEVRREQTEPADAPEVDGLPEPVADTRPLPVVHHADVDEHPLDSGSVDAVAMYASDAQDERRSSTVWRRPSGSCLPPADTRTDSTHRAVRRTRRHNDPHPLHRAARKGPGAEQEPRAVEPYAPPEVARAELGASR